MRGPRVSLTTTTGIGLLLAIGLAGGAHRVVAEDSVRVYLPHALRAVSVESRPTAVAVTPLPTVATAVPSGTPRPTETQVPPPPTITPRPSSTPEPTEPLTPSSITGHFVFEGEPLPEGYGQPDGPQIELRRCRSADGTVCPLAGWERVAATTTDDVGAVVFRSPAPLDEGELYQVWWVNDDTDDVQGDSRLLKRWWSRVVEDFGPGDQIDLGVFDVTDLRNKAICHDCGQTLPITFEWHARSRASESYRWSLFRGCGDDTRREGAWRTAPLGHVSKYTLESPPPGFREDEKYCWFVFIDDGENGTGWPFFDWRVTFLPQP